MQKLDRVIEGDTVLHIVVNSIGHAGCTNKRRGNDDNNLEKHHHVISGIISRRVHKRAGEGREWKRSSLSL